MSTNEVILRSATPRRAVADARETLDRFMVDGRPDASRFAEVVDELLQEAREDAGGSVRAYGEMVDLLWKEGNHVAAVRLEALWNDAIEARGLPLICAPLTGSFHREADSHRSGEVRERQAQDDHPRELSSIQQGASALESEVAHLRQLEGALRDGLRECVAAERELRASLEREHEARQRAEADVALRELFLGIVGHDLRNPLNTILMTGQLMELRGDLPQESRRRVARIVSSGLKMQGMITQLLDATRARFSGGIPISPRDMALSPLVATVVDELRVAHPGRAIHASLADDAPICADPERIEQVIRSLLGNAITHGDPGRPITLTLSPTDLGPRLRIQSHGAAIPAESIPFMFEPFTRSPRARTTTASIGLGLYIAERILHAHGGTIHLESTDERGTIFEVSLPRRR